MSTSTESSPRIEVIYPKRQQFLTRPSTTEITQSNIDHLQYVGRLSSSGEAYADKAVIEEVKIIRSLGSRARDLVYHATNSAALSAIARHEAILSSQQLIAIEEPILTGEISSDEGWLHRHNNGLPDVYASGEGLSTTYTRVTGNHFPVIFGIVRSRLENPPSTDYGDGMRLGGRVALGCVAAQIVPFDKIPTMKEWSAKNCPEDAITMSSDAAFILAHDLGYDA